MHLGCILQVMTNSEIQKRNLSQYISEFVYQSIKCDMDTNEIRLMPKVIVTNEDCSFNRFLKVLHEEHHIFEEGLAALRCKQGSTPMALGNRFKKVQLEYTPISGMYSFTFQGNQLYAELDKGECVLTTECRIIDYIKNLTIYGPSLAIIKNFFSQTVGKCEGDNSAETITIYENNNGHWGLSKQKKPRTMESVIFKQQFIDEVIEDIQDFIDSEQWYTEMGIPYKRSYLLYGPPGTGKSSFAQALAGYIHFSICFVNCSDKVNDFQFNNLLNRAPKKSIILIEDVDSIFSQRKNTQKNNSLTFSGFLNAIDGVRSQEGRILMLTTNYKQRLDPALLRPGRVDQMYEISFATRFQMQRICFRFFKDEELAKQFASKLPEGKFSMSMIQGFLLKYRKRPDKVIQCMITDILESDENIKISKYLEEINCQEVTNDFKIEECYTLASARNLPKQTLEKMIERLSPLLKGRLLETIRQDRRLYLKSDTQLAAFIQQNYKNEEVQRGLREYLKEEDVRTFFQIRDKAKQLTQQNQVVSDCL